MNLLLYKRASLSFIINLNNEDNHRQWGDFEAIVENENGRIAICSRGDVLKDVIDNIERYKDNDYVIVTSRNFATFDEKIGRVYFPIVVEKKKGDSVEFVYCARKVMSHIK